jgi:hypothetical protein
MARQGKFSPGNEIRDIYELISLLKDGRWIYWQDRPKHPSFLLSMQLNALISRVGQRSFRLAIPNRQAGKDSVDAETPD